MLSSQLARRVSRMCVSRVISTRHMTASLCTPHQQQQQLPSRSRTLTTLSTNPTFPIHTLSSSVAITAATSVTTLPRRWNSSDSHPDFAAKRTTTPQTADGAVPDANATIDKIIEQDVTSHDVFLYMKGQPNQPRCGFSGHVVAILKYLQVPFASKDVLEDELLREGVKVYSNWPTIPQLYVKGEFVGGADIINTMFRGGELTELFDEHSIPYTAPEPEPESQDGQQQ
jgi:monothiol glutaredoxin